MFKMDFPSWTTLFPFLSHTLFDSSHHFMLLDLNIFPLSKCYHSYLGQKPGHHLQILLSLILQPIHFISSNLSFKEILNPSILFCPHKQFPCPYPIISCKVTPKFPPVWFSFNPFLIIKTDRPQLTSININSAYKFQEPTWSRF